MENKALKIEQNLKENANFYNNTDFSVEYVDCNLYNINWNESFIDMLDIEEIESFYKVDMIEVGTTYGITICIKDKEDDLPF